MGIKNFSLRYLLSRFAPMPQDDGEAALASMDLRMLADLPFDRPTGKRPRVVWTRPDGGCRMGGDVV